MTNNLRKSFEAFIVATGYHTLTPAEQARMFRVFCAGVMVTIENAKSNPNVKKWLHDAMAEIDRNFTDVSRN